MKLLLRSPAVFLFFIAFTLSNNCFSQLSCIDSSLEFNGNNQYVELAPNGFSDGNFLPKLDSDYTIECLVRWNGGAPFQRIFDFNYGENYFMFLTPSEGANNVPRFAISATGLTAPQVLDANIELVQGIYHHIAVTYSKADSLVTMYIDGINVNSAKIDIDADSIYYGSDAHNSSANYIGLSPFAADPQFNGNIDEFRISDTVRYADNFTPAVPFTQDSRTIALYHFDDGSGQMAADSSGNNYDAQLGSTIDVDDNDPSWVTCSTVLASSFSSFTAKPVNNQVQLDWNAASDANTRYFEIQKSADAVHFTTISKMPQAGTSGNHNYSYTDASPAHGNNYYHLKKVDANNESVYSKTVYINMNGNSAFKIYPTVASGSLHISISQTPSTIIIYNLNGKAVKTFRLNNAEQNINISSLPSGNYIVKNITTNSSLRFVKQ